MPPAISVVALPDDDELHRHTEALIAHPPDILIATTGIGFRSWVAAADGWGLANQLIAALSRARVVARGPKATGALRDAVVEGHRRRHRRVGILVAGGARHPQHAGQVEDAVDLRAVVGGDGAYQPAMLTQQGHVYLRVQIGTPDRLQAVSAVDDRDRASAQHVGNLADDHPRGVQIRAPAGLDVQVGIQGDDSGHVLTRATWAA